MSEKDSFGRGRKVTEVMKGLGNKWKLMNETQKAPFVTKHQQAKDDYERQLNKMNPTASIASISFESCVLLIPILVDCTKLTASKLRNAMLSVGLIGYNDCQVVQSTMLTKNNSVLLF